ncbi:MAG: hypothetical protein CL726_08700 [Chloroflexi bacterium]|nr:hypothetical protein [Chloroflexota bacterium]
MRGFPAQASARVLFLNYSVLQLPFVRFSRIRPVDSIPFDELSIEFVHSERSIDVDLLDQETCFGERLHGQTAVHRPG